MARFFFGKRLLRFPGDDFLGFLGHRIRELGTYSMCAVSPTKRPQLQSYFEATGMICEDMCVKEMFLFCSLNY
jgi:hypothetical protein